MIFPAFHKRLQDLADNIAKDESLLKDFEDAWRYEDDPRRKARYIREIEQLKDSVTRYHREYNDLEKQMSTDEQSPEMQTIAVHLQQMDAKLNLVLTDQVTISQDLYEMQQSLMSRYDNTEQVIIAAVAQKLTQKQLAVTQTLLDTLEANQLSDLEMQQMLALLEERIPPLFPEQTKVAEIIKDPGLDTKHRLKVALPIIPFILDYEGELELGASFNIKTALEQLKTKLWRK